MGMFTHSAGGGLGRAADGDLPVGARAGESMGEVLNGVRPRVVATDNSVRCAYLEYFTVIYCLDPEPIFTRFF